jgi:predicted Fe-S protein YdhL (DUF1289 family)
MILLDIDSPCIKKCNLENKICTGCHRTVEEITSWMSLSDIEKHKINTRIKNMNVIEGTKKNLFVSFQCASKFGGVTTESAIIEWDKKIKTEEDLYELQKYLADWKGNSPNLVVCVTILFFRRVEE